MILESLLLRQSECGSEKNFQTQSISEKSLLGTKSRDNAGTAITEGRYLLTGQDESTVFVG